MLLQPVSLVQPSDINLPVFPEPRAQGSTICWYLLACFLLFGPHPFLFHELTTFLDFFSSSLANVKLLHLQQPLHQAIVSGQRRFGPNGQRCAPSGPFRVSSTCTCIEILPVQRHNFWIDLHIYILERSNLGQVVKFGSFVIFSSR